MPSTSGSTPTVVQLRAELRELGLPTTGRKADLMSRLAAHAERRAKPLPLSEAPPPPLSPLPHESESTATSANVAQGTIAAADCSHGTGAIGRWTFLMPAALAFLAITGVLPPPDRWSQWILPTVRGGPAPQPDAAVAALVTWIERQGGVIRGVMALESDAGGGRGLFSTRDLLPGELTLQIPRSAWLSAANARTSSGVAAILESDPVVRRYCGDGTNAWTVILALEHERHNSSSHWRPYIDALPDPTSPVLWTAVELESFESVAIASEAAALQEHLREAYAELFPHLCNKYPEQFNCSVHTYESFTWSALSVWGRAFDLSRPEASDQGLIPLMDYANHRFRVATPTSWDTVGWFGFEAPAEKVTAAETELFISYGDHHTSVSYLMNYGFVPGNSNYGDYVAVVARLTVSGSSRPVDLPLSIGTYRNASVLAARVGPDGWVSEQFLTDCLSAMTGGTSLPPRLAAPMIKVLLSNIESAVAAAEAHFKSTLEEDAASLANGKLGYNEWVATATRVRHKRILRTLRENLVHRIGLPVKESGIGVGTPESKWKTAKIDALVDHFGDTGIHLAGDVSLREALYVTEFSLGV